MELLHKQSDPLYTVCQCSLTIVTGYMHRQIQWEGCRVATHPPPSSVRSCLGLSCLQGFSVFLGQL